MSPIEPRPGLRNLEPYQVPQLSVPVRLNTNESPYPLPQAFREELAAAVLNLSLNRYPDREATGLREALAEHAGHPVEGTWAANGSNEIIQQLLLAYGGPGRRVAVFEPTYVLHERLSWIAHSDVVRIELDRPWLVSGGDATRAAESDPRVVFVCSPNNPTGNAQPIEVIEELAATTEALVIVDHAYVEFGGETALPLVARHPNLAVVRTFSKAFALAGARIGYCLAAPEVIDDMRRVRLPYHLSALTQAAGAAALRHADEASAILGEIRTQRDRILRELRAMGTEAFDSDANFVLFRPPRPAAAVWSGLVDRGVLVRDLTTIVPECLRVTAGTPAEIDRFLEALEEVLR
ncbi:MAG: histidinol-phosphate transaminase [Actinomycetota bacterium]